MKAFAKRLVMDTWYFQVSALLVIEGLGLWQSSNMSKLLLGEHSVGLQSSWTHLLVSLVAASSIAFALLVTGFVYCERRSVLAVFAVHVTWVMTVLESAGYRGPWMAWLIVALLVSIMVDRWIKPWKVEWLTSPAGRRRPGAG